MFHFLDHISPSLPHYLYILDSSSEIFKKRVIVIRTKNSIDFNNLHKYKKSDSLNNDIDSLMNDFHIPQKKENTTYLLYYLLHGLPNQKWAIHYNSNTNKNKPCTIKLDRPSIALQIYDKISIHEWGEIFKQLNAPHPQLSKLNYKVSCMKDLINENTKFKKSWTKIDLWLTAYKLKKEGNNNSEIVESISKFKIKLGFGERPIYTWNMINIGLKKLEELLRTL